MGSDVRALVLGAGGQLGVDVVAALETFAEVDARDRRAVDLADVDSVTRAFDSARYDVVVNAGAHTDVDGAERDSTLAFKVNRDAVAQLGALCRDRRIALVHVSTDFVFDGALGRAYRPEDAPNPLGVYGQSKLEGEQALAAIDAPAIVLRTAWVWSLRRKSFVTTMLRLFREREEVKVVDDQVGNPTLARDLATAIATMLARAGRSGEDVHGWAREHRGVHHLAGEGEVSRFDFARAIAGLDPRRAEHAVKRITPISSGEMSLPAKRPTFAPLDCTETFARLGVKLPAWRGALERALADRATW
ncbi:MAG: dTDP-4-dehydrorhamnose reductase [Polyangiales bacterium]